MNKEIINISGIKTPTAPFNYVLSSQLSADLKTNKIMGGNIIEQTRRALENIKFLLEFNLPNYSS